MFYCPNILSNIQDVTFIYGLFNDPVSNTDYIINKH